MFKKIVWVVSLAVVIAVGIKGYLTYSAYSMLEQLKKEFADSASVNYGWLSADFDGKIAIEDLAITVFRLKRSFAVSELSLEFGSATNLIAYTKNKVGSDFEASFSIQANGVSLPLKGKTIETWIKENHGLDWLSVSDVYACPASTGGTHDLLKKMGVNELNFDVAISFSTEQGHDKVDLIWDINQTGRLLASMSWGQPNQVNLRNLVNGSFELANAQKIEFEYRDEGFIRRLRNICDTSDSYVFPELSSLAWQNAMASFGWQVNEGVQVLYRDYLSQGGIIRVKVGKPHLLLVDKIENVFGRNIVDYIGFEASVNNKMTDELLIMADEKYFRVKMEKESPKIEAKNVEPKYQPKYREIEPAELKAWIEKKVKIRLKDGKVYEGLLQSVAEHKIDMLVNVAGGTVVYSLKPFGIEKAEVWR